MEYREYKPHALLAPYVECYWSAYSDRPPFRQKESLIPDGTIELMFNFGDNYLQRKGDDTKEIKGSHVIGIRKESLTISQSGKQNFFCIRFRLGGTYPFFRLPVSLFSAAFYTLEELFGNQLRELEERLYDAKDNAARVQLTDQYLLRKAQFDNDDYAFTRTCLPHLLQANNVAEVARDFNTGYKTLERKFQKVLGLSPSEVIKISRFNKAVLTMYSCQFDSLTGVAYSSGYYDQSHFIREFRQLTGFAPKEFLREQFTIVQVIQPALADRMSKLYNF
jgi:AraC-like DNA-binding protein